MRYLPTIGLEIHAQLATETKIFCGCTTSFGAEPNDHSCPVCLGMPGVLPVLNRRVVELAMRLGLRIDAEIQSRSWFARKNYFYPDLPKGYQISMYEFPIVKGGHLDIDTTAGTRRIRINRAHLEEDAGKLVHMEGRPESYFDVNRCGVPLLEIVTEPDFESTAEVAVFLAELKDILIFSGISNGNMEQGNIRVDANTSIRPAGQTALGTRTEIKNMNSFANVVSAIEQEIERQIDLVESGGRVVQETLLYDPLRDTLASMRSKEEAHDYRYFPEPDLVPIVVDDAWIERVRSELPELRGEMRERFQRQYGLSEYDADVLTAEPDVAGHYETLVTPGADPKKAANWVMGEVLRRRNETQTDISAFNEISVGTAALLVMVDQGTISGSIAKKVYDKMLTEGGNPKDIVMELGLQQISDTGALTALVNRVIADHPGEIERYRAGTTKLFGFFVGQVMKLSGGKANPNEVNALLREMLG